jgi:hypothetical protein
VAGEDMLFQHHVLIEFLVKEEFAISDNYTQLQDAYGDTCMGTSRADDG